ncbi:MAG: hypothetical protein U0235_00235 [Polyangiaceae bacterium]
MRAAHRAGALSIHLELVLKPTQSTGSPARLFFTWTTDEEAAVAEIVGASGAVALRHALAKSAGPRVDMQLVDEQGVSPPRRGLSPGRHHRTGA